ncbi:unnamed protein product, partial [Symbiodinium pilosum]
KGGAAALGFVMLMITTQNIAVVKAVEAQVNEYVVWFLVFAAGKLSILAVWRSFQSICHIQLTEAYLVHARCIENAPTVVYMDYALAFAIFSYTLIVGISLVATFSSFTDAFRLVAVVIGCFAGPVISLLLKIRASGEADEVAALMKMVPADFKRFIVGSEDARSPGSSGSPGPSWCFAGWEDVIKAGRQDKEPL